MRSDLVIQLLQTLSECLPGFRVVGVEKAVVHLWHVKIAMRRRHKSRLHFQLGEATATVTNSERF